jgi:Protein of unknown function (DUF4242)
MLSGQYGGRAAKYGNYADVRHVAQAYGPFVEETGAARRPETEGGLMELYGIIRRNGWATPADLEAAAARSTAEGDKEGSGVRWIRSYVLSEESGELGTFCVYEADSPEAIREHARVADLPVDEVVPIADTVIVRADPAPATA